MSDFPDSYEEGWAPGYATEMDEMNAREADDYRHENEYLHDLADGLEAPKMSTYTFAVTVETETAEQAARVMTERINHDEDYGFSYLISHALYPVMIDGEDSES